MRVSLQPPQFGHVYQVIDPDRRGFKRENGQIVGFSDTDVEVMGAVSLFDAFKRQGRKPVLLGEDLVMTPTPSLRNQLYYKISAIQTKFPWVQFNPRKRAQTGLTNAEQFQVRSLNNALHDFLDPETHAFPVYRKADAAGRYHWEIPQCITRQGVDIPLPAELYRALGIPKPVIQNHRSSQ